MPGYDLCQIKCEPSSDDEPSHFTRVFLTHQDSSTLEELAPLTPAGPAATPVCVKQESADRQPASDLEVLEPVPHGNALASTLINRHRNESEIKDFLNLLPIKDEPTSENEQQHLSGEDTSDSCGGQDSYIRGSPKSWTQQDMDNALDALRNHNMTLTKASAKYGIPSTTLWQRAHRLGIDTPKKEGAAKSWTEEDLRAALQALRAGAISANKASKAYGIPSSTLYKIARREGIRLAAPFNAAPTSWRRGDLARALSAIRCGAHTVQRAAAAFGIPTGTLYGRCKREGIELSRSNPTPWSEDAMGEALDAVRVGQMSINQAAIHFNLPYSSLYGRFKRIKYQSQGYQPTQQELTPNPEPTHPEIPTYYQHNHDQTGNNVPEISHSNDNYLYIQNSNVVEVHGEAANTFSGQYDLGQVLYYPQHEGITTS